VIGSSVNMNRARWPPTAAQKNPGRPRRASPWASRSCEGSGVRIVTRICAGVLVESTLSSSSVLVTLPSMNIVAEGKCGAGVMIVEGLR
jgi:hypothetical protein